MKRAFGLTRDTNRRKQLCLAVTATLMMAGATACGAEDEEPDSLPNLAQGVAADATTIAWLSPNLGTDVSVGDVVELSVNVSGSTANAVHFSVDGTEVGTCDTTGGENECRRGQLFRTTTTFTSPGSHILVASLGQSAKDQRASLTIDVQPDSAVSPDAGDAPNVGDSGSPKDAGAPIVSGQRGFLDPDRPSHNVYGGVFWTVQKQSVGVVSPPAGSPSAVAACMQRYGKSIVKYADMYKISRASIVATALTESNCTNPKGSSDGLSSGPMQVTGSTCAATVGGGISSANCKAKMYADPDFSFLVGAKYMGSAYQLKQHAHDPPKIAAAYNAGSVRQSSANRWHMIVTGNHVDRFVGGYNAYRDWESMNGVAKLAFEEDYAAEAESVWEGEHVEATSALPKTAVDGQVFFVGDWKNRDGRFVTFRHGVWVD